MDSKCNMYCSFVNVIVVMSMTPYTLNNFVTSQELNIINTWEHKMWANIAQIASCLVYAFQFGSSYYGLFNLELCDNAEQGLLYSTAVHKLITIISHNYPTEH